MNRRWVGIAVLGCIGVGLSAGAVRSADELQGAGAALKALQERQRPAVPDPNSPNPVARLRSAIQKLAQEGPGLPPSEAAHRWVELLKQYEALDYNEIYNGQEQIEPVQLTTLFDALPPPAAWPALVGELEQRKPRAALPPQPVGAGAPGNAPGPPLKQGTLGDPALRLLIAVLKDDREAQWREMAALLPLCRKDFSGAGQQFVSIYASMARQSGDPKRIARAAEFQIVMHPQGEAMGYWQPPPLPDLVKLVGSAEATRIIKLALAVPGVQVQTESENATTRLARSLALQMTPTLRTPQWTLAQSIDATALYEALSKRFRRDALKPAAVEGPGVARGGIVPPVFHARGMMMMGEQDPLEQSRQMAMVHYFLGLISLGRTKEATALIPKMQFDQDSVHGPFDSTFEALKKRDKLPAVETFLRSALRRNPELPLWALAFGVADRRQLPDEEVAFLKTALTNVDIQPSTRRRIRQRLSDRLLAKDEVEDAIAVLRQMLGSSLRDAEAEGSDGDTGEAYLVQTWGVSLLRLGKVLKRPELIKDTLALLKKAPARADDFGGYYQSELADQLIEVGEYREAESALIESLAWFARQTPPNQPFFQGQDQLIRLASLYHRAGRPADVLRLLKEAPNWSTDDLAGAMTLQDAQGLPLGHIAAASMAKLGDRERAGRTLEALLLQKAACDPAYQLYAELKGVDAIPFFDRLTARDSFEPRSLIWKAWVLQKAGRLQEAEAAARAALAVDPLDLVLDNSGMKAGTILAEVLDAQGRTQDAEPFRRRRNAFAQAELAERFQRAGLALRAAKAMEAAVEMAPDDAIFHLALASLKYQVGDKADGEEHLRIALSKLPGSIGRQGAEALLGLSPSRPVSLEMAEKAFAHAIQQSPEKPQAHYLLGLVAKARENHTEAHRHFTDATRRDPDFLAAWAELVALTGPQIDRADHEAAVKAVLRLDPSGRHSPRDLSEVRSARALYEAVAAARKVFTEVEPAPLLTLDASKAAMDKLSVDGQFGFLLQRGVFRVNPHMGYDYSAVPPLPKPGGAVAGQTVAAGAITLFEIDLMQRRQAAAMQ